MCLSSIRDSLQISRRGCGTTSVHQSQLEQSFAGVLNKSVTITKLHGVLFPRHDECLWTKMSQIILRLPSEEAESSDNIHGILT